MHVQKEIEKDLQFPLILFVVIIERLKQKDSHCFYEFKFYKYQTFKMDLALNISTSTNSTKPVSKHGNVKVFSLNSFELS